MTEYVSINGHVIRANAKNGTNAPPIRVARSKSDAKPRYAHEIKITGPSRLRYTPKGAIIKCGARLVIEAPDGSVRIVR